jgi:hypothetical protein
VTTDAIKDKAMYAVYGIFTVSQHISLNAIWPTDTPIPVYCNLEVCHWRVACESSVCPQTVIVFQFAP